MLARQALASRTMELCKTLSCCGRSTSSWSYFLGGNMSPGMAEAGRVFSLLRLVRVAIWLVLPLIFLGENALISRLCLVSVLSIRVTTPIPCSAGHPASFRYSHSPQLSWVFKAPACYARTVECLWCFRDGKIQAFLPIERGFTGDDVIFFSKGGPP